MLIAKVRKITFKKVRQKVHKKLIQVLGKWAYLSYWRYLVKGKVEHADLSNIYLAALPNPGAGIGHQITNWISGYCWAKQLGLKFAHLPFSTAAWDEFLGFGKEETQVSTLKKKGWHIRRIPYFKWNDAQTIELTRNIISSYSGKKIIILCEQDQGYHNLYDVMGDLKAKFYAATAQQKGRLKYDSAHFNVAIHVRRGDIMSDLTNENLAMRYLSNDYYEKVLQQVVERYTQLQPKPVHVYFFSQGKQKDYPEFFCFDNLHWCLDMGAQDSFLHMVYADLLITSKSSFSYKPALMSNGIKVCPEKFWHTYPNTPDWIMCDNNGIIHWK